MVLKMVLVFDDFDDGAEIFMVMLDFDDPDDFAGF